MQRTIGENFRVVITHHKQNESKNPTDSRNKVCGNKKIPIIKIWASLHGALFVFIIQVDRGEIGLNAV